MKDDSATVALGAEKTVELVIDAELRAEKRFGERPDGPGADLERHLAKLLAVVHLRFVLEAEIDDRQTRRRGPERAALDDPGRQRKLIPQVAGSAAGATGAARRGSSAGRRASSELPPPRRESSDPRRESSRSTVFIMTDGVVSAWSLRTVR